MILGKLTHLAGACEHLGVGLRASLVLATRESPEDLLEGRSRRCGRPATVVKERLDRVGADDLKADYVAAEVEPRVDRDGVVGEVLPERLGEPVGDPLVAGVRVGILPESVKVVDDVAKLVSGDLLRLGVADVLLHHDPLDRHVIDSVSSLKAGDLGGADLNAAVDYVTLVGEGSERAPRSHPVR